MTTAIASRRTEAAGERRRRQGMAWQLPVGREWLIALLMLMLPIERVLVLQVGTITVRPVFALMAVIIVRELAVQDWPWAVTRSAQQLMRGVLVGMTLIVVAMVTGVWPYPNVGYCAWLLFSALFLMAMVRTITVRADLERWARWAVSAASFWAWVALAQWVLAATVVPAFAYSFLGPLPRVHALTYEPSFLALYLLPHVFLAHQMGRRKALAVISLALVLSTSRLGLIGLVAGVVAISLLDRERRRKTMQLAAALVVGLGLLTSLMVATGAGGDYTRLVTEAFNSKEQSSTAPRLESWEQAQSLAAEHMPFGVGPGGYGAGLQARGEGLEFPVDEVKTTNLWLETLAEIGVGGLIALAAWSVLPLVRLRRRTRGGVPAGLFLGACAVLATFPLFQTWERPQLWVWWGLVWAAAVMPLHGRPAQRVPRRRRPTRRRPVGAGPLARVRLLADGEIAQAGMALGGRVASTAASLTLTVVTARALGPSDRGVLVLAILAGFLASILIRSVSPALAYELALLSRGEGGSRGALVADSWRTAGVSALLVGLPAAAVFIGTGWGAEVAVIMVATVAAALLISTPIGTALADGRMGRLSVLSAGYPIGAVAGALAALVVAGTDLLYVAIGWSAGAVIGAMAGIDRASLKALRRRRRAGSVRRQSAFSLKAAGSSLVSGTANRADILMLGLLSTTTSVGLYSVAVGASELVWFAGEALALAAYGRIGAGRHRDAVRDTWRLCGITTAVAAVQAVVLALFAHDAMELVFGEQFRVSGDYLRILVIGSVLGASVVPVTNYLTNQLGRPLLTLFLAGTSLAATAGVCLFAIPRWGATGAAIASTSGYAVGLVMALTLLVVTGRERRGLKSEAEAAEEGSGRRYTGG